MPAANDIRRGQVIKFNGEPHLVMETQHRTPGNLRAFVQIKMRNLRYGKALDQRFASTDTIEVLPTDKRSLEFSYADRDAFAFIDPDTFDQIELSLNVDVVVTGDPGRAAADLAARTGLPGWTAETVLRDPAVFIGSVDEIVATMQQRRAELGFSYFIVSDAKLAAAAPVISRLAGQ